MLPEKGYLRQRTGPGVEELKCDLFSEKQPHRCIHLPYGSGGTKRIHRVHQSGEQQNVSDGF